MPDANWWKQITTIPMRRLLIFVQRSLLKSSRPVGREEEVVGFEEVKDEQSAKDTMKVPVQEKHHRIPLLFLDLPAELLLAIADFLEREFRVLLSLSCRRLRVLLKDSGLDLSLCDDMGGKLRFLRYFERDYPEHLTCRSCGFLYKWRACRLWTYRCPRAIHHSLKERLASYAWCMQGVGYITVTREVVDLIFRAHEQGQQYGLPLSYLSSANGSDHNGVARTNEARIVDGQLLLASRLEVDAESRQDMVYKAQFFNAALCLHWRRNVRREKIWQTVEQAVAGTNGSEKPGVSKCPFCATDFKVCVQNIMEGRVRIILDVWRNYGQRYENMLANEHLFHREPSRINTDELSQRDIHAVFESYGSGIDSVRVC